MKRHAVHVAREKSCRVLLLREHGRCGLLRFSQHWLRVLCQFYLGHLPRAHASSTALVTDSEGACSSCAERSHLEFQGHSSSHVLCMRAVEQLFR